MLSFPSTPLTNSAKDSCCLSSAVSPSPRRTLSSYRGWSTKTSRSSSWRRKRQWRNQYLPKESQLLRIDCSLLARHNLPETVTAIGLTHYRRYFGIKKTPDPLEGVFSLSDWNEFLKESPVILPPKRNYFIETVESQYVHAHHSEDIETLRSVLAEKHSEYLPAFEKLMRGRKTHILNMFVMRRDLSTNIATGSLTFCLK